MRTAVLFPRTCGAAFLACGAAFLACGAAFAQPAAKPLPLQAPVRDKNFYLLSLFETDDAVRKDPVLARIAAERKASLEKAAKTCALDLDCYAAAFQWTDAQIAEAGHALALLRFKSMAELRSGGMYVRYEKLSDPEMLEKAWADCARGMNRMIDLYALGKAPRYPAIDSMTYDAKTDTWKRVIQNLTLVIQENGASLDLFFSSSQKFALEALWLNHRDESGRYEPMESGENAAALAKVKTVDWSKFPYSALVIPGAGNDRPGVRLSAAGKLRDEIAAKRFRDGKAPFIIVSGGHVHPNQTEYAEALEMKRDLMARLGVPESAIIVDPHARHTTTNMRNAARLMYRYGIPFDKKALVSTDASQSAYIEDKGFEKRCLDELGYVPYRLLTRTSPFDIEFLPLIESLQSDPIEPLDP